MTQQTITRKGSFDSGHRVMNERLKCFNLHGHTYLYELTFNFTSIQDIGYSIDFKEIKRIGCQWIEDTLDHGMLINPHDTSIISLSEKLKSKKWIMSLNGKNQYCNPTVENIAKELFLAIQFLLDNENLNLSTVRLYETPNCFTDCFKTSILDIESKNFFEQNYNGLLQYKQQKGKVEYDDRLV